MNKKRVTFVVYSLSLCLLALVLLSSIISQRFDVVAERTKVMLGLEMLPPDTSYHICFSPDNTWFAATIMNVPVTSTLYHTRFEVGRTDGAMRWTIVDESRSRDNDILSPECLKWSSADHWLYFTNRSKRAANWCRMDASPADLHKIDLQTSKVENLAPPLGRFLWLSADETAVVYERPTDRALILRNLASGQEHILNVESDTDDRVFQIIWAPDASAFIITIAKRACTSDVDHRLKYPWGDASSLIHVDIQTLDVRTLIQDDSRRFVAEEWPTANTVVVRDQDWNNWEMNVQTGQLTPQTK